jgi:hypothetical protein
MGAEGSLSCSQELAIGRYPVLCNMSSQDGVSR